MSENLKCTWTEDLNEYMQDRWGINLVEEMTQCMKEVILKRKEDERNRIRIRNICDKVVRKKHPNFKR